MMEKALKETFIALSELKNRNSMISGMPSGIERLDKAISGFNNGHVIVIAGRPACGKTSLALGICLSASRVGNSVAYFSMDKSKDHLTRRLLSQLGEINYQKLSNADLTSEEWVNLTAASAKLAEFKLTIYDERMDFSLLCMAIIDHKTKHGLDLVVIDYLQGMTQDHANANDYHKNYTNLAQNLKDFAKSLNICIVILTSTSRALETRDDKRPHLGDLTFTGTLECEADVILMIYREVMYKIDCESPEVAEIIIAKNSGGSTGTVYTNFINELMLFEDIS